MHYGNDKKILIEEPVDNGVRRTEQPETANANPTRPLKATA